MAKFDTKWLIQSLKDRNIPATPLEDYINDTTPILFRCDICGHEWKVDPSHLKGGRSCPNCRKLAKIEKNKQDFLEKAQIIHKYKYSYDKVEYTKQQNKVIITCPVHGDFEQTPNSHLNGRGCPWCAGNNFLRTKDYFVNEAIKVHGNKYNYDQVEYINCKVPVLIKCNNCGIEFLQTPDGHLAGHGCPNCRLKSQTELFEKLRKVFKSEEILFEVGNRVIPWLEGQRFDIYFPKYNIAVEYNGKQHYVPVEHFGGTLGLQRTQERDELKRQKCKNNNCSLFEVKYDYTDKDFEQLVNNIQQIMNNF